MGVMTQMLWMKKEAQMFADGNDEADV